MVKVVFKRLLPALFFLIIFLSASQLVSAQVLNEIMPHPVSGPDWLEIYNPTLDPLNVTGWSLVDSTSTITKLSGSIPPFGFITADVSNRLNNSGDTIFLKNPLTITVDSYSYSADPGIGRSLGRFPDAGSWKTFSFSSKGTSNSGGVITPITSPSPSPTPQPTKQPTPKPTPTKQPTLSAPKTNFSISGVPAQTSSNDSFAVFINLSLPNDPNSKFYLKGSFKKVGGSNYFGFTKVGSLWIKNNKGYSSQASIITDSSGNYLGNLEVKPDSADSGFSGSGDYSFKVGRYSSSGSGPTWSNELSLNILAPIYEESENSSQVSSPLASSPRPSPTFTSAYSIIKNRKNLQNNAPPATVAGVVKQATSSSNSAVLPSLDEETEVTANKSRNFIPIIGGILIALGLFSLAFIYLKHKISVNDKALHNKI